MRTTKTAISVMICVFTVQLLNMVGLTMFDGFFAGIGAVNAMQPTIKGTKDFGFNRIFGTIIGGIVGILLYIPNIILLNGDFNVIFAGIGTIITISVINMFNKPNAVFIGCIVFTASVTKMTTGPIIPYMVLRTIETSYGILVTIIVNKTILPPKE